MSITNINSLKEDIASLFKNGSRISDEELNSLIIQSILNRFDEFQPLFSEVRNDGNIKIDEYLETEQINSAKQVPNLLNELHIHFYNSLLSYTETDDCKVLVSKDNLRLNGAVYTDSKTANFIIQKTIEQFLLNGNNIRDIKILDFGAGTGNFYWEAFDILKGKFGLDPLSILNCNLFAIDKDEMALKILKARSVNYLNAEDFKNSSWLENIICGDMLIDEPFNSPINKLLKKAGEINAIVSNPPYFLLKVNKKNNSNEKTYNELKTRVDKELNYFRNVSSYNHSIQGMLNYYKISIERMLQIGSANSVMGVICPPTLFGDLSSTKLRKHLIKNHGLKYIKYYNESDNLFYNVTQSASIFILNRDTQTDKVEVSLKDSNFDISLEDIENNFSKSYEVPQIPEVGWDILRKVNKYNKLKSLEFIRNRRGELDLTQFKNCITKIDTGWNLIRGKHINKRGIDYSKCSEYVDLENFLSQKSNEYKENDFNKRRLVGNQISNMDLSNRLKFVYCSDGDIISNSCNYISASDSKYLEHLYVLLNSTLLNWRFKVTSTNNHINNYELDELPILPFDIDLSDVDPFSIDGNITICEEYGLSKSEINWLLNKN